MKENHFTPSSQIGSRAATQAAKLLGLVVFGSLFLATHSSRASVTTWDVVGGTLISAGQPDGTVSGDFSVDNSTNTIVSFDLTVTGVSQKSFVFDSATAVSVVRFGVLYDFNSFDLLFGLGLSTLPKPLPGHTTPVSLFPVESDYSAPLVSGAFGSDTVVGTLVPGTAPAVPEISTLLMVALALLALAGLRQVRSALIH